MRCILYVVSEPEIREWEGIINPRQYIINSGQYEHIINPRQYITAMCHKSTFLCVVSYMWGANPNSRVGKHYQSTSARVYL